MEIRREENKENEVAELYYKYNFFKKTGKEIKARLHFNCATFFGYEENEFVGAMMIVYNRTIDKMECDIIIEENYRGNGYAGQFLKLSETLNPNKEITHKTSIDNIGMQRVFEKNGYQEVSRDDVAIDFEKPKEKSKKPKENIMIKTLKMK